MKRQNGCLLTHGVHDFQAVPAVPDGKLVSCPGLNIRGLLPTIQGDGVLPEIVVVVPRLKRMVA
ncbi:MAG: hypothetical protein O2857_17380 [Planctomycetota bacterium]|nr:hypothetical protein [Planctomycetota bacterium]